MCIGWGTLKMEARVTWKKKKKMEARVVHAISAAL